MRCRGTAVLALIAGLLLPPAPVGGQTPVLKPHQKNACARQLWNAAEVEEKLPGWARDVEARARLPRPRPRLQLLDERGVRLAAKCAAILEDVERNACPVEHPEVAALVQRAAVAARRIEDLRAALAAEQKELAELERLGPPRGLQKDLLQVQEIVRTYGSITPASSPEEVVAARRTLDDVLVWLGGRHQHYGEWLATGVPGGARVRGGLGAAQAAVGAVQQEAARQRAQALRAVPGHVQRAQRLAEQARRRGSVEAFQRALVPLQAARQGLALLEQLGAEDRALTPLRTRLGEAETALRAAREPLRPALRRATPPPADRYRGADRPRLREAARAAVQAADPGAKVLDTRIPHAQWQRSWSLARANGMWVRRQGSRLEVAVLVEAAPGVAVVRDVLLEREGEEGPLKTTLLEGDGPGGATEILVDALGLPEAADGR
jgi:hypothetical protein